MAVHAGVCRGRFRNFKTLARLTYRACRSVGLALPALTIVGVTVVRADTGCDGAGVKLALTESYILHSAVVGRDYRISVALPLDEHAMQSGKLPVIYLLDADELFGLLTDTTRLLQDDGEIPAALVVGIGYPIRTFAEAMEPRSTDFTPAIDRPYEQLVDDLTGGKHHVVTGGAERFLRFIRDELKPFVAAHYSVSSADTTFVGHSLGGLFGLYVLFHAPDTFERYVIGSPCIRCGDSDLPKREMAYAATHGDLAARVYMDIGTDEADVRRVLNIPANMGSAEKRYLDAIGRTDSVVLFRQFAAQLQSRRYPGLHLQAVVEANEGHESLPPILMSRGLRFVYSSKP